jgi:hypothetical protein
MHRLEDLVEMLDHALNTKTKRHITGGVLLSISLLFGGLAVTIMTLKTEDIEREHYLD